jgi:predicted permease
MFNDLRYALRMLSKHPGFTISAVTTLALGIGFVATIFTIVKGVAYGRLPFEDSGRIMSIGINASRFDDLAREQTSCESIAFARVLQANLRAGTLMSRYSAAVVSANFLEVLRTRPIVGRGFSRDDESPASSKTILIGHAVWIQEFQQAGDVVGRELRVNGEARTIIGVMPEGFGFPRTEQLWMVRQAGEDVAADSICFARLKPNVSPRQAALEFAALEANLAGSDVVSDSQRAVVDVVPFTERWIKPQIRIVLTAILGATLLVLLLACVNVTNLFLSRAVEREREFAVRTALGASRQRLVRQLLTETLLVATLGAVGGTFMAWGGSTWIWSYIGQESGLTGGAPFWINFDIDARVLGFVASLTLVATLLTGVAPALQSSRVDLNSSLKQGGGSGLRLSRTNRWLVNAQLALSVALVIFAGLFLTILIAFNNKRLPYDPNVILTARVALDNPRYETDGQRVAFYEQFTQTIAAMPGVKQVGLTSADRFRAGSIRIEMEGDSYLRPGDRPSSLLEVVSDRYFDVFPLGMLQGRPFSTTDRANATPVAIVNAAFTREFERTGPLVGRRVRIGSEGEPWLTIIGVAADMGSVKAGQASNGPVLYRPIAQVPPRETTLLIHGGADTQQLISGIRKTVTKLDPELVAYQFLTVQAIIEMERIGINVPGVLFVVCGIGALVLAAVGVYGVISFSVKMRTRELGVRLALGATRAQIVKLILKQGLWQISFGIAIGLLLAAGGSMMLRSMFVDLGHSAFNLWIYLVVVVLLGTVGMVALLVPALRGSRVDPMVALRAE